MTKHVQFFGDAEHAFQLTADQLPELERVTGAGIGELCRRLFAGAFRFADLIEIIRLALIGGGSDPQEAAALVKAYVAPRPLEEGMILATAILSTLYFGAPSTDEGPTDEQPGELDLEALA